MKVTIIGAGAHRVFGILRGALARPGVLDGGQIHLHDLNAVRSEAMGRMLMKTPEFARAGCAIHWEGSLDQALEGADVVGVIMPACSQMTMALSLGAAMRHGFISSDNVSPTGAMCAVRVAPVILDIARRMEKLCPSAWLVNFVNPVAVLSSMVNRHTKIKALGVCAGYQNHLWDLSRLCGRDEEATGLDVDVAGVNHISYILRGTWQGEDLFRVLQRNLADWRPCELQPWRDERIKGIIHNSVSRLHRFWRELGVLVFSTEGDGMDYLMYEEAVEQMRGNYSEPSAAQLEASLAAQREARAEADRSFQQWVNRDLDARFWAEHWKTDPRFVREDQDLFVRIFSAVAGVEEAKIVTSRLNCGAISGIKDSHVVEYSQYLSKTGIRHEGPFDLPGVVHGLTAGLAAHQTLLGDALAGDDPRELAHALLSYPMRMFSPAAKNLYRELFKINPSELPIKFLGAFDYF